MCVAHAVAEKKAVATAGGTTTPNVGVKGTTMTTPNAAEPGCWDVEEKRFRSKWLNGFLLGKLE